MFKLSYSALLVLFSTAISYLLYCLFVNLNLCGFGVFVRKKMNGFNCQVRTVENDKNMYYGDLINTVTGSLVLYSLSTDCLFSFFFYVFSTVHHSIGLFLQLTLMHNSITTRMSHYYPRHVSGLDMPILRRNDCTNTASDILALLRGCTLHRLRADSESALNRCGVQPLRRVKIPDAVFVQSFLLRMGMSRPETCRG